MMEDNLWWKMTYDWRRLMVEDDLWWKTTFNRRRPLKEDDLRRKTTFDGRGPLAEDGLWKKTTFDGRRPLIGCIVYYLRKMFMTPHLDGHSTTDPKSEILSAVRTGKRISRDGRNVCGIMNTHICRKDDISRQRRLSIHHASCIMHHASVLQ